MTFPNNNFFKVRGQQPELGMAIGVESYQLRRVRWPVVYRSKTKKDHDLRFDTSTAPKAYRIASVWILRLRYGTRFHVHVFGGAAPISAQWGLRMDWQEMSTTMTTSYLCKKSDQTRSV
ncbi:hypothetical protein BT69DRAFT_171356 [Atractiella rhizophila]|nr:hypothetical protein BT69DRAFT_171356 [Atractiella rhizophila]